MGFLKAFTIVTLWILLSFFWVSLGQSKEVAAINSGEVESWIKPYPHLDDWYRFFKDRNADGATAAEFFKTLASSESLATKLNQARVTFDQFYVPVSHLMTQNWEKVEGANSQRIQTDLISIDHSLGKILSRMNAADQDYFRAMVLLDLPSEFASLPQSLPEAI